MPSHSDPKGLGSQRCDGPKAARREAVALGSPLDFVGLLARDHQPALRRPPSQRAAQRNHGVST